MQRKILIPALIMAAGVATAGGLAYGKPSGAAQNEAVANLAQAKISLAQSVTAAEQHVGGRASRAELENENGRLVYGVEVADNNNKTMEVKVDATNGKIFSAQFDKADDESKGRREEQDDD